MRAVRLGQLGFEATRPGSSLSCQMLLLFRWHLSEFAMVPMAQLEGQRDSEAVGTGSRLCRAKYFYDFSDICQKFQWVS